MDHDSIMSDVGVIEDGSRRDSTSSPNVADPPPSSPDRGSQSKGSGESKKTYKTLASDIAKTDVTMIDVGAQNPPLVNASSLDSKPRRSKVGEKRYASDPRKLDKMHSFDNSENKELFKA